SDVLHATRDLRKTLERVKLLLASSGTLMVLEATNPWLGVNLVVGLLKGWWLFEDNIRRDAPTISQDAWEEVLGAAGFAEAVSVADCPDADIAQRAVIIARGPQLAELPPLLAGIRRDSGTYLLFVDEGDARGAGVGRELARCLRRRGDHVIEVKHGAQFERSGVVDFHHSGPEWRRHGTVDRAGPPAGGGPVSDITL